MSEYTIVLADKDDEFLATLELRLQERFGDKVHIQTYSDPEHFHLFFLQPRIVDMLIVSDEWYSADLERHTIHTLIRLAETQGMEDEPTDVGLVLYKYAGMKEIFHELSICMSTRLDGNAEQAGKMVCVYSACGGAGTTTVALGLASALARAQKTVLYLGTESLQSAPLPLSEQKALLDSRFANAMLSQDEALPELVAEAREHCGFDFLPSFDHSIATYGLTLKHFELLAERLRDSNSYQYIIIDCSSEFTAEKSMLISKCDHTLVVTEQSLAACQKTKALLRDINVHASERFFFVCNKFRPGRKNFLKDTLLGKVSIQEYIPLYQSDNWPSLEDLASCDSFSKMAGWIM